MKRYIVDIVSATRGFPGIQKGASPRAGLMLMKCSESLALIDGLEFVTPDLIQELAGPIIAHRLVLGSDNEYSGSDAEQVFQNVLSDIPVPV